MQKKIILIMVMFLLMMNLLIGVIYATEENLDIVPNDNPEEVIVDEVEETVETEEARRRFDFDF